MTSQLLKITLKGGGNMHLRKGIVAEINLEKGAAIVFTTDGDIVEVQINGQTYNIGDQIFFYEQPNKAKPYIRSRIFRYVSGLAAALLLFFANPFSISDLAIDFSKKLFDKKDAYAATLFVESKKSNLKVGVDREQNVVSVFALNQPTKKVLEDMGSSNERGNENINEFLNTYFQEAKRSNELSSDEPVVISVDPTPSLGEKKSDLVKEIQTVSKKHHIQVVAVTVPDEVVKKATALGITPGKLVVALVATIKTGADIPLDKLEKVTVTDLVNTVPDVTQTLSTCTEEQLVQLAKQTLFVVSTPVKEVKPQTSTTTNTKTSNSEIKSTVLTTTNTQNIAIDTKSNDQSSKGTIADSTNSTQSKPVDSNQSMSEESAVAEKTEEQQPETTSQPVDDNKQQPTDNNEQSQKTQATQDNQDQGQTQDNSTQEDQTQADTQDNQAQDTQDNNQTQDNQVQSDQTQQAQNNQTSDQQLSTTVILFNWINKIIG